MLASPDVFAKLAQGSNCFCQFDDFMLSKIFWHRLKMFLGLCDMQDSVGQAIDIVCFVAAHAVSPLDLNRYSQPLMTYIPKAVAPVY